jgi:hypothetical protein
MLTRIFLVIILATILEGCGTIHYATVDPLIMYEKPDITSAVVARLRKHSNVRRKDSVDAVWADVEFLDRRGYVLHTDITRGRAITVSQKIRIGAVCWDGTTTKDTSDEACRDNGGVKSWRERNETTVRFKKN